MSNPRMSRRQRRVIGTIKREAATTMTPKHRAKHAAVEAELAHMTIDQLRAFVIWLYAYYRIDHMDLVEFIRDTEPRS